MPVSSAAVTSMHTVINSENVTIFTRELLKKRCTYKFTLYNV